MDENLHPIDDLFKKAIDDHDEAPSPKVWENIDKNLDKNKVVSITRKYEKWKWVAAALFIFSIGMAMYTWNLKLRYKEVEKGNKQKTTNTYNQKGIITDDKNSTADKLVTAKDKKHNSAIKKNKKLSTATDRINANNQNTIVKVEKSRQPGKSNVNNRISENKIPDAVKHMPKNVYANNERKPNKKPSTSSDVTTSDVTKKDITAEEITSNSVSANRNKNVSATEDSSGQPLLTAEKFEVETAIVSEPKNILQVPPPLISSKALSSVSTESNNGNTVTKAGSKALQPAKNTVSIFFSPSAVSTRLRNDQQHFREDDRREIKQNENRNYAYTIGALFERNLADNFTILTGLSLANRVTEINSKTLFARPDNRGNVNYRISCSAGYAYVSSKRPAGPGGGGGNRPSPGDSIMALSTTTTLQYLSVPAGVRYNLSAGKFSFNPAVAFAANFITKKKIETVLFAAGGNENTTTGDIQGLKPAYFDASIRTDFAYNLSRTIGISLPPSARFALSSITKDGPVKTYVNTFGLGLGLNVHF